MNVGPPSPWVLLPGMLLDERLWSSIDLPGACPLPLSGTTVQTAVDAVLEAAPPRFCLAGLSLGGIVAMALVAQAPNRVEKLSLLATNALPPTAAQRAGWDALERRVQDGDFDRVTPENLWPLLVAPGRSQDHQLAGLVADMARSVGPEAFLDQLRMQRSRSDLRPGLAAFRGPVHVVAGAADALCSVSMHQEIAAACADAQLTVLPDSGHLIPLESAGAAQQVLLSSVLGQGEGT